MNGLYGRGGQYGLVNSEGLNNSTIRFDARLVRASEKGEAAALVVLPRNAGGGLGSRAATLVEGTMNGFPFRGVIEVDGKTRCLKVSKGLQEAAGTEIGDSVTVEITRVGEELEVRAPIELREALAASPAARRLWEEITPMARRDWILWITSAKQAETRQGRIDKACSMLGSGKRRVCCFGGLTWLTKDYPSVETWAPLRK